MFIIYKTVVITYYNFYRIHSNKSGILGRLGLAYSCMIDDYGKTTFSVCFVVRTIVFNFILPN